MYRKQCPHREHVEEETAAFRFREIFKWYVIRHFSFWNFFFVCLCVLQTPANINTTHKHVHAVVQ